MNTATHAVEVPFPQAFASPKRSPFPSAPGTVCSWLPAIGNPTVRWECALRRGPTQPITTVRTNNLIR